ncbi:MAG: mechanosensitive ion channel protein MscS [SAR86 cluster bacterium]|uniref:Small-conductance mechanosensitive channel n=1 Tax=SAR86 cluster bacterium TaxID=2030880 RepID=A0A2A5CGA3_9GAMM|nr:mechanosensitive ion channel [Gammaproteobacteria bacterium AH-315-E17]PCJ42558.1 MAG: mechanosensitive ion channel protein MscS [SAR86 cluster bacterium]
MEDGMSILNDFVIPWGIQLIIALAIFILGKMVAKAIADFAKKPMTKSGMDNMLVKFLSTIIYSILLIAVVLAAVDQLGINITSLLAIVGAAGLAIGLALKDSLSNFAAGVMIIIYRPFKIGDYINAGGSAGTVDEIGLFCTLMHSPDNQRIIIPNSAVIGGTIVNVNALGTRRIDLVIGIGYDDNIGQARDIILGIIDADPRILKDPEAGVALAELADSSVNFNVRPWVKADDYWTVRTDLLETIKLSLDQAGISIPYPQQDVHMHAANENQ